ncbi:MAG: DHHA1 domain-containing protein [Candidatus Hermodarchaeota archaeon]
MVFLSLSKFTEALVSSLKEKTTNPKVMLIVDNDLDGITSAALIDTVLYELSIEDLEIAFRDPLSWDIPYDLVDDYDPDIVILLDIASNSVGDPKSLARLAPTVFQIDHHITKEIGHPQRLMAYNPVRSGEVYIPTVFLSREIGLHLNIESINSKNANLVTLIGLFADAAISYYREENSDFKFYVEPKLSDFYEHCKSESPKYFQIMSHANFKFPLLQQITSCMDFYNKDLGLDEGFVQLVNAMERESQIENLFEEIISKYDLEFLNLLDKLEKILNYYENEPDMPVINYNNRQKDISNSTLSRLLVEHTGKAVVVHSTTNEVLVSARLPKSLHKDLVPIFEKYGGGGHSKACGARIRQEDLPLLLQDVENELNTP